MSAERATLERIREDIEALRAEHRDQVEAFAYSFRRVLHTGGSLASIALALVHAEEAVQAHEDEAGS